MEKKHDTKGSIICLEIANVRIFEIRSWPVFAWIIYLYAHQLML